MSGALRSRPERRYRRLTLRIEIELETPSGRRRALATTLGAGGLFVATDTPLDDGERLRVHFRLPDDPDPLCLTARVVWREPPGEDVPTPGMGLEFTDAGARSALAVRLERLAGPARR